jgi:hypothetical protein
MAYSKFQLRCIDLGLCVGCGDRIAAKSRRCEQCAARVAARERRRYLKVIPLRRQRRAIAAGRLSYVTVKEREG